VAGIADRLGHAVDRAVDQVAVVELVGTDVLGVEGVPGLLDEAEVVAPEDGAGVAEPSSPKASGESRPTPIPTLNVSTRASPMAARRMIRPRPRPAAGDAVAREGPAAREVASGGSGSMVGSVGVGWVSGGSIGLGSCRHSNGLTCAAVHRALAR
jgi:hypothetical protein